MTSEGANYLAVCDQASGPSSEGAAEFAAAIRAVLSGKLDRFEAEYACHSPTEQRWFVGRVTRFPGEGPVRVVVAHENTTQLKRAELKLAGERNLLRTMIDNLPDFIYAKDTGGRFLVGNLALARSMGVATPEELPGKTDADHYPPASVARHAAEEQAIIRSGEPLFNREEPLMDPAGSSIGWLLSSKVPLRDPDGAVIGLVGIGRDITERKQAEEALRESEARLRMVLENMPVMLDALDENLNIIVWNRECERVTGYSAGEILQHPYVSELLYPDPLYRERMQGELALTDHDYRDWEWETTCKDGSVRTIVWSNISRHYPVPGWASWGIGVDITERKQMEEALQQERNLLRTLIDTMPDYIFVKDRQGRFVVSNLAHTQTVPQATSADLIGHTSLELYPSEPGQQYHADDMWVMDSGETLHNAERQTYNPDGTQRWVLTTKVPLKGTDGQIVGLVGVSRDITQRKQAEEALRVSEERYRLISQLISDYAYSYAVNPDHTIVHEWMTEDSFKRVTGFTQNEIDQRGTFALYHPEDAPAVQQDMERVFAGEACSGEYRIITKSGELRWLTIYRQPFWDAQQNRVVRVYGSAQDITERKRAEAAERDHRILAEALRDSAAALISALDLNAVMNTILENVARVVTHDLANIMLIEGDQARVVYWHGYPPDQIQWIQEAHYSVTKTPNLRRIIETGLPDLAAYTAQRSDWVHQSATEWIKSHIGVPIRSQDQVVGILNLDSRIPGFFTEDHVQRLQVFADQASIAIEHAQLYEEIHRHAGELAQRVEERTAQLNHAKERTEAILNSSSDVMILCRTDSLIDQVNPAFDESFGCTPDEIFNQPLAALAVPEHVSLLKQTFETVVQTRQPQRLELTVRYQASAAFDGEMMLSPVVGPDQHLLGIICSLRDITERKTMEVQLRQMLQREMELGELKSRYMSMAAHDLRNPLAAILMAVEAIQKYHDRLTEAQRQAKYDSVRRSVNAMVELLNDTLTIGQAESGKLRFEPGPLDLIALSQNLVADFQQSTGGGPRIKYSHQGLCNPVYLDAKLLRHILGNLLSNALKYSPADSTVTFDIQCEASAVTLRVQDHGIGIPQADQARLFEAFHRAGNVSGIPGTGLGLAIVKQSVDLHGGTITFESEEGVGTTVTVVFPQPGT